MIRAGLIAGLLLTAAPARPQEAALTEFVVKVLAEGKPGRVMSMPAALLGIAKGSPDKSLTAAPGECEDGAERSFSALTQGPPRAPAAKELARRELDFWLLGTGRRPPDAPEPVKPGRHSK